MDISYSALSGTYGIPFHSEAAHDEHGEEHEGEHAKDSHGEDENHDELRGERIFSTTESEIFALSGSVKTSISFLNVIDFAVKNMDY